MDVDAEQIARAHENMMQEIASSFASHFEATGIAALSPAVENAMRAVPRHKFVDGDDWRDAYLNRPLPIGYGQTISQPYIVALMSELTALSPDAIVLEIGTGSGYQTAILAHLARKVFTIEIVQPLAERAAGRFADLGIHNVECRLGDGYLGWPEAAPFDAILVAAAPADVPEALVRQLKPGGRLVMPVGRSAQQLIVVQMQSDQSTTLREIVPVCFVPLTRHGGDASGSDSD